MTDELSLRPVCEEDLALLERLTQDPAVCGEFNWFGWIDVRWRRDWEQNRLLGPDRGVLIVAAGTQAIGFVNWRQQLAGENARFWRIGIGLLPQARGHGYGTRAHQLLAGYLFAHTTVHRIEAWTEAGNLAERRALEGAGFTMEGTARGAGWRDGAWRDYVIYSVLRTDLAQPDRAGS